MPDTPPQPEPNPLEPAQSPLPGADSQAPTAAEPEPQADWGAGGLANAWEALELWVAKHRQCVWANVVLALTAVLVVWMLTAPSPPPAPGPSGQQLAVTGPAAVEGAAREEKGKPAAEKAKNPAAEKEKNLIWVARAVEWVTWTLSKVLEPVFTWLIAYPLFPLQLALFLAISWLGFGQSLGFTDLVWSESRWFFRFWAGMAVSLLFGNVLFVRYILDTRPGAAPPNFDLGYSLFAFAQDEEVQRLGAFLLWTWLPLLVLFYVPKLVAPPQGRPGSRRAVLAGLAAGVGVTVGLVAVFVLTERDEWWRGTWVFKDLPGVADRVIEEKYLPLHAVGTVFVFLALAPAVVLLVERVMARAVWSPVWLLCLMFAAFNLVYGLVTFHLVGLQYVLLAFLGLIIWVCNTKHPGKMSFPGLETYQPLVPWTNPDIVASPPTPEYHTLGLLQTNDLLEHFHNVKWATGLGQNDKPVEAGGKPVEARRPKLVIVATTGGGIRAAVWTAVVLEGLEAAIPGVRKKKAAFRDHIRLITGASGGMQAAALYTADFHNYPKTPPDLLSTQLAQDSLWPTVQTLLLHDLPGIVVPWNFSQDRGRSLEEAWKKNTGGTAASPFAATFQALKPKEETCDRPSIIFSPMLVEDCRRLLISNLTMDWFTITTASNLNGPLTGWGGPQPLADQLSVPAVELWRLFPKAYGAFEVGTAARMSATFPFVGPAVSLPTKPARRVVDAGYFDNFGINLAALWLYRHKNLIETHTSGVVIVEVRAYPRRWEKLHFATRPGGPTARQSRPELLTWAMSELSSPAEAVINLYSRGAYFRNDQVLDFLDKEFNTPANLRADPPHKFFTTVAFECDQEAALSWSLPEGELTTIRNSFNPKAPEVLGLANWFGDGGTR